MVKKTIQKLSQHNKKGTLSEVIFNIVKYPVRKINNRYPGLRRDIYNKLRYGPSAPLYYERIWIDPRNVCQMINKEEISRATGVNRSESSALVVDWDKVQNFSPIIDDFRMQYCFKHWRDGVSWEELGVYDFMAKTKKYGKLPRQQIVERFEMLDRAFEEIKKDGRMKTRQEVNPHNFREKDGLLFHIGREGKLFFGGIGFHRLAMAQILELKRVPAVIGIIDRDALKLMNKLRIPPGTG